MKENMSKIIFYQLYIFDIFYMISFANHKKVKEYLSCKVSKMINRNMTSKRLWLHCGKGMEHNNITQGSALWQYKWGTFMEIRTTGN